jgi:hypothetical protein
MPFVNISQNCRIEVYFMNEKLCENYNDFHIPSEPITPGYYYEKMVGPFSSKQIAIDHAKTTLLS